MVIYLNQYLKDDKMIRSIRNILPGLIFVTGAALMVLGALRGELSELLRKAIVVCLECIGIG